MPTVSSIADRLDMTEEMAVEKLRYMMFDVDSVESEITDEMCDLLIDVDDDDEVATRVREEKLEKLEKEKKRNERLRENAKKAGAKRKAAAAKKKAAAEKKKAAAAKKKAEELAAAAETPPVAEIIESPATADEAETTEEAPPVAEIISSAEPEEAPVAEIIETAEPEAPAVPEEPPKPGIVIGTAIDHDAETVHVVRADGTEIKPDEVDIEVVGDSTYALIEPGDDAESEEAGIVAEAEREVEEQDLREQQSHRPVVKADPAVVAEVKRKAAERMQRLETQRASEARQLNASVRKTENAAMRLRPCGALRPDRSRAPCEPSANVLAARVMKKNRCRSKSSKRGQPSQRLKWKTRPRSSNWPN